MTSGRWQDGLRLDSGAGPATRLSEEEAERMVQQALDNLTPARPKRSLRWGWAAAAAIALFILAPAAVAAFNTFVLPVLPKWRPARRAASAPPPAAPTPVQSAPAESPSVEPAPAEPTDPAAPLSASPTSGAATDRFELIDPPEADLAPNDRAIGPQPQIVAPKTAPTRRRARPRPRARGPARAATAESLLASANQLRAARAFAEAARTYAQVRERFARSGPAYVAAVAEGQLRLGQLNEPASALVAFEDARDMRPKGPLDAEARFGRGAALSALGRRAEARRAWADLIRRHPNSAPAKRAEARMRSGR